eukprot:s1667_g14.t1
MGGSCSAEAPVESPRSAGLVVAPFVWILVKEYALCVFCVYDFISDIWVAQANAHARQTQLHNLGYIGALLLCVSGLVNCLVFRRVRNKHEHLFQRMLKKAPLQWHICRLLACTNPEVVSASLPPR